MKVLPSFHSLHTHLVRVCLIHDRAVGEKEKKQQTVPRYFPYTYFFQIHKHGRAVAEREEFMLQWAEDVDALRLQLGTERKEREDGRRELEGTILDLEDEVEELKV